MTVPGRLGIPGLGPANCAFGDLTPNGWGLTQIRERGRIDAVMMMGWEKAIIPALVLLLPQVSASGSLGVVINEVLYDPDGQDTGREFIELHNRTGEDICLYYYEVATGNGAYPNRWTGEWRGGREDTIRARGFFVIGEDAVVPPPDHATSLDLQNGPDACRLVSPGSEVDLVGWGAHEFDEYYEGSPASGSGSGLSLGRDPDGTDTDDNSADFTALARPSPGGFNHPPYDLAVSKACLSRYSRPDHATLQVILHIMNLGTGACGKGARAHVACCGREPTADIAADIAPGAFDRVAVGLPNVGEGLHPATVWVSSTHDVFHDNDTLATSILIWPAPLVINEFMFRPATGECEWIEVLNRSPDLVGLEDWTIEDSGSRRRHICDAGPYIAPGGYLLLVEDEQDFVAAYPDVGCAVMRPAGGWPTLNDTDGRDGYADMIVIRDAFGTCVDSVAYARAWGEAGASVERIEPGARSLPASNWSPHYGAGGASPGRSNSVSVVFPEPGGYLRLSPRTFSPDGDGDGDLLSVSVEMPEPAVVRLKIFDINGRPLKTLLDGDLVEERRITFWDGTLKAGRPAPTGLYVILLEARPQGGGGILHSKLPVVLVRR
jgi:hypothetical protein